MQRELSSGVSTRVLFMGKKSPSTVRPVTVGPILGAVAPDSARVWGRGGEVERCLGVARIRCRLDGDEAEYSDSRFVNMKPHFDWTGVFVFPKLLPLTKYEYQIGWIEPVITPEGNLEVDMSALDWSGIKSHIFSTASDERQHLRSFVFGSCQYKLKFSKGKYSDDRGDKIFKCIGQQFDAGMQTDALLMLGDQIFADGIEKNVDAYCDLYRDHFTEKNLGALMARLPTYMTMNDHEIEASWPETDNGKTRATTYPAAMHSFLIYQMSHSPLMTLSAGGHRIEGIPKKYWYAFKDGCCDFFILDGRTERTLDENNRKIISEEQMLALQAWLVDKSEGVKFIGSCVPFFPDDTYGNDATWGGFTSQRKKLLDFIRENKIPRVVFLSGHVNSAMGSKVTFADDPDFQIVSLVGGSFFWPFSKQFVPSSGSLEGAAGYSVEHATEIIKQDNFARVTASSDEVTFDVYSRKNKGLARATFTFSS
mmetsp:Transcript_10519/g.16138  ORF Transcript_10519/g.16138 Transcript_10519/m.16138 type:complete len:480 (-) Transcript_10519:104-1543(-)|eukprot:CAMPEP_0195297478 /NCGR_PEP_ID=MMETSP0707-20130614/21601_1 /TAXON_ID=33640 /ORGANISM="Asterionellopsis glacialis, Strain CCMP134" /LENGTH=479 /DNA_ID=CAMNT_0040359305 /DNA_START=26 /DNA_END=1465 /DNA_ORIENTATION=-